MQKKIAQSAIVFIFLALIFIPAIMLVFGWGIEDGTAENRKLAELPEIRLSSIPGLPAKYDDYLNDHFPFRNWITRLYSLMLYKLRSSSNETVIIGDDGWLFYNNPNDGASIDSYIGRIKWTDEELENAASYLQELYDSLERKGISFLLCIAPNKERAYSEYLQGKYGTPSKKSWPAVELLNYLRKNTSVPTIYLFDDLLAAKREYPNEWFYYQLDTHWNLLGGYVGCKEALKKFDIMLPELNHNMIQKEMSMSTDRDLANMLNLGVDLGVDRYYTVSGYATDRSLERSPWELFSSQEEFYGVVRTNYGNKVEGKLLLIRDSFGTAMMPYFASTFQETAMIHRRVFRLSDIQLEAPQYVIYEIVERNLYALTDLE